MPTNEVSLSNGYIKPEDEVHAHGHRHILQVIEHYATTNPGRIYAAIPRDPQNPSAGFRDITYSEFANAINHCCHWLNSTLPLAKERFETIAYAGPKDIRYSIIICAMAKLERKVLALSPQVPPAVQAHLIQETACKTFIYGGSLKPIVENVAKEVKEWDLSIIPVLEIDAFIREEKAEQWVWKKSWEEARHLPWFIIHTSGSTGLPKPITYTHEMMTNFDAAELMPEIQGKFSMAQLIQGKRWYSPLPVLHLTGMYITIQWPVLCGSIIVFGHPTDMSPTAVRDALIYGNSQALLSPPLFIDALASGPSGLELLRGLKSIWYAGAPMSQATADKLLPHVQVMSGFGTTETGAFFTAVDSNADWEYLSFLNSNGIEFEQIDGDLYELLIVRKPELARWQQIFKLYPELQVYRTGDLWVESKKKPGSWKVVGRTDDLLVLSHGSKMNTVQIEVELSQCQGVRGVVVGGRNRDRPHLLVEWANDEIDEKSRLAQLWPAIEKVNARISEYCRIQKDRVLFTAPGKNLVRNVKGGPVRKSSLELYEEEIKQMYDAQGSAD